MKYIVVLWLLIIGLGSCSTDEIEYYDAERYLYFTEVSVDSIKESFFFYPGEETIGVDLLVRYAGKPIEEDMTYRLEVDENLTTAQAETDYEVALEQVMPKGQMIDTLHVILRKTAALEMKNLQLALRIVANENFQVGPLDSIQSPRIIFTSQAVRPTWWDQDVIDYFLGAYSEVKYQLFIQITGISDMSQLTTAEKRIYSIRLKNYLIEQRNAGTPVMDGNVEMSVPVL